MNSLELLKKDIKHLDQIITVYKEDLSEAEKVLHLSGKRIDIANAEQTGWADYYHQQSIEVKYLKEHVSVLLDEVYGRLWKQCTEKMDRVLVVKDKDHYIKHDPEYLAMIQPYLKISELYEQFQRVNESFHTRGYALNNLTRLIVAQSNDWIIS
jgi:hypothetical protein